MHGFGDGQAEGRQFVVLGAGPAGLSAAFELTRLGQRPLVLEKRDKVGGLARTEQYHGFSFDMGGHRFFSKSPVVNALWREILGQDFLHRPRLSRIFYRHRFFHYPLKLGNALWNLGPLEALLIVLSYARWRLFPYPREDTFEEWVTNRFGRRLFETFFRTYTEKVWGISCRELKAEWAAQRIRNLSLPTALLSMVVKPGGTVTSLIEAFDYPRRGPGMMWQALQARIEQAGGVIRLNADVQQIFTRGGRISGVLVAANGQETLIEGTDFISSMPLSEFVRKLNAAPPEVVAAAGQLKYRDFLLVGLIVAEPNLFPDNWIYMHDPSVRVGRIQNFGNWSPDMVPEPGMSSLGLEYFCNEGDALWNTPDAELIELAKRELEQSGLVRQADVVDGCVFRVEKSYPVYDSRYRDCLAQVRAFVDSLPNFQPIGRNGLHRYNNQDHAMLTGLAAARNLALGERNDLWRINADPEYHEEAPGQGAGDKPAGTINGNAARAGG